jgi:hypothetical protein
MLLILCYLERDNMDGICTLCADKLPCNCKITQRIGPPQAPQPVSLESRVLTLEGKIAKLEQQLGSPRYWK